MKKIISLLFLAFFSVILVSGCGSNDAVPTINGTAATGKGIIGTIIVKDANGTEVNARTDPDGTYSVQVPAMVPPFIVSIVPDDGSPTLYSFATAADQRVNVTPLTNQALSIAAGNADLASIFNGWDGTGIKQSDIDTAQATLLANLSAQLTAAGLDPASVDLFADEFETDGSGFDGVLDILKFDVDADGVITVSDTTDDTFSFDPNIDISSFIGDVGTDSGAGSEGGGPLASNEEAATIPAALQKTFDVIFILADGVDPADSPYANEETLSFTVGADNSLSFADTTLTDPVLRNGNQAEAIWKQSSTGLEYALSTLGDSFNPTPGFNEINLSMGSFGDSDFVFIGQFRDAAKYAKSQMSAGTLSISGAGATTGATNLGTETITPLMGSIRVVDTTTTYLWTVKSTTDDAVTYTVSVSVDTGSGAFAMVNVEKYTQSATFGSTNTWTLQGTVLADLTGVAIDDVNSMVTFTNTTLTRTAAGDVVLNGTFEFFDFSQ